MAIGSAIVLFVSTTRTAQEVHRTPDGGQIVETEIER
ncbi:hypothetical protein BH24ACT15_BH24ACT15_23820 [soil metagenome]|jgi:hypothetical protein